MTLPNFSDLGLFAPILGALAAEGYTAPTPIQFHTIPPVLGDAICAASHKPEPVRPQLSRYLQRLAAAKQRTAPQTCRAPRATPRPFPRRSIRWRPLSAFSEKRVTC